MPQFAPQSILCPVDLSSASPTVLRWARLFAETYRAKLEVLYADYLEYPPYFLPSQVEDLAAKEKQHRAALEESLVALACGNLGPSVRHEITILEGHPVEAILEHAATRHPGLIVMGSHGRSGVARVRLGSVAEHVMREAATPTVVVRALAGEQDQPRISRVLCPVNFTEQGQQCLELSARVAAAFRAQLVVVHSIEQEGADLEETRDRLCQWIPRTVRQDCYVTEAVRHGNPAEQILLAARDAAVDLIVLVARRRPFLEFTTLGTTTERVMRHADSAVLVLPGEQRASSPATGSKGSE
jgi:nucleotide-binding universal stress UspA family protein